MTNDSSSRILRLLELGQSMVEFALVMPFLMLIIVGTFDLGRAIYYYNAISASAREAARHAIICGGAAALDCSQQDADTKNFVVDTTVAVPLSTSDITITPSRRQYGDTVTVSVGVGFTPATPFISNITQGDLRLTAQASMVAE